MNNTRVSWRLPVDITWWRHRIARWFVVMVWLLALAGLALRFTVRDRFQPWAVLFYMTPLPVLAWLFLLAGWMWSRPTGQEAGAARSSWTSLRGLSLLAGCACVAWTWWSECPAGARPVPGEATQLVFWNIGHCRLGAGRIAEQIRRWDKPIVALAEVSVRSERSDEFWRTELPDYTIAMIQPDGMLAVKGEVLSQRGHHLSSLSWCNQFDVRVDGREMTVLIVDVASNLFLSRQEPLRKLTDIVAELNDRPVIIVGDFNTPDNSVWFEPLRQQAKSGIRMAGSGYTGTWPNPLPVLTLDQLWFNDRCEVFTCRYGWTALSDHRPLFAELLSVQSPMSGEAPASQQH